MFLGPKTWNWEAFTVCYVSQIVYSYWGSFSCIDKTFTADFCRYLKNIMYMYIYFDMYLYRIKSIERFQIPKIYPALKALDTTGNYSKWTC